MNRRLLPIAVGETDLAIKTSKGNVAQLAAIGNRGKRQSSQVIGQRGQPIGARNFLAPVGIARRKLRVRQCSVAPEDLLRAPVAADHVPCDQQVVPRARFRSPSISRVQTVLVGALVPPIADENQGFVVCLLRRRMRRRFAQRDDRDNRAVEIERPDARACRTDVSAVIYRQQLNVIEIGLGHHRRVNQNEGAHQVRVVMAEGDTRRTSPGVGNRYGIGEAFVAGQGRDVGGVRWGVWPEPGVVDWPMPRRSMRRMRWES